MSGGATLLLGNGEPGKDADHDMVVDSASIGDKSVPALVPRYSTGQDDWRASARLESGERDMREATLRGEGDFLRQRLAATEA